ncbi:hypothetical protein EDD76_107240 [Kineothrix alysoides]|uniref:Uncharacterized protein n=1 Tax=Kineothrix alysoides TaxID=1469948 RepID=A0A4R1QYS9_9FIRM|nr:hypothetical protein EDD76_107240 [Kineothrix alysoides]
MNIFFKVQGLIFRDDDYIDITKRYQYEDLIIMKYLKIK